MSTRGELRQTIWERDYEISSFLVNSWKCLGLYALLNLLQDIAWAHATHLGHGFDAVNERRRGWILTRQKLRMVSWPEWGESIRLRTWIRRPSGPFAIRDFEVISLTEGARKIGEATTSWVLFNTETRKPVRTGLHDFAGGCRTDGILSFDAPKIDSSCDPLETLARFEARRSDLDINQHVNNTRYARWILDSIPLEGDPRYQLGEYEVNFLAEAGEGDWIVIRGGTGASARSDSGSDWVRVQGWREWDSKRVFTARLRTIETERARSAISFDAPLPREEARPEAGRPATSAGDSGEKGCFEAPDNPAPRIPPGPL